MNVKKKFLVRIRTARAFESMCEMLDYELEKLVAPVSEGSDDAVLAAIPERIYPFALKATIAHTRHHGRQLVVKAEGLGHLNGHAYAYTAGLRDHATWMIVKGRKIRIPPRPLC